MPEVHSPLPRPRPQLMVLQGRYCRLEPLAPHHALQLFAASSGASNRSRFDYLWESQPGDLAGMQTWIAESNLANDPLRFAVVDAESGRCEGRQALMRITPEHGCIELGGIYWGRAIARTRVATEACYLHLAYAFDALGYRRFEWKCDNRNEASKRAALRFGFCFEGVFRQHMVIKGSNRDTAWFAIINQDWPQVKAAFEAWLQPGNFDVHGRQVHRLQAAVMPGT
jgi:RimJ/RimL family protein N-acetyltransferase